MDINEDTEEPDLIHVSVTSDMSKDEVVKKIIAAAAGEKEISTEEVAPEISSSVETREKDAIKNVKIIKLKTDCKYSFM